MKIIAIYSIRGGVGKTAACVNMAYLSAQEREPTLLCDLDPQGSSSFYFSNDSSQRIWKA
ncbi:MAG: AAA family ATPase [Desulfobacterales bacterium]